MEGLLTQNKLLGYYFALTDLLTGIKLGQNKTEE